MTTTEQRCVFHADCCQPEDRECRGNCPELAVRVVMGGPLCAIHAEILELEMAAETLVGINL